MDLLGKLKQALSMLRSTRFWNLINNKVGFWVGKLSLLGYQKAHLSHPLENVKMFLKCENSLVALV